jgi:hemolysin activation/secretion protein
MTLEGKGKTKGLTSGILQFPEPRGPRSPAYDKTWGRITDCSAYLPQSQIRHQLPQLFHFIAFILPRSRAGRRHSAHHKQRFLMRRVPKLTAVVSVVLFLSFQSSLAQTRSANDRKVVIESFVISGTQALDSAELAEITNSITGSTFSDDAEELQDRVRAQFQDRGYFYVDIQKVDVKVIDPLATPKLVRLEAQVSEGTRCRLSGIEFTDNDAITAQELRAKFRLKTGDKFARAKIAAGLEGMRDLYNSRGFLEEFSIPDAKSDSSSTIKLSIEVHEGPQYRMNNLEILGPSEVAEKLHMRWKLAPGAIFNKAYVETFLEKNRSLLPDNFTQGDGVQLFTDCRDGTVSVHIHLTQDPNHVALDRTEHVDCPSPAEKNKE